VNITVNGEAKEVPRATTVAALLPLLRIEGTRVAVELNREIVPKSEHAERALSAGDKLAIVTMVGGG
jgi:sulfur carrier protein